MDFNRLHSLINESISPLDLSEDILIFLGELSSYQSNHYGSYNVSRLYNAYSKLNSNFKKSMIPSRKKLKNSFRGDDGIRSKSVISFTYNSDHYKAKKNASFYGKYVLPFSALENYDGLLDTSLLSKYFGSVLWNKITNIYEIGDDENEILVFGSNWKESELNKYINELR